MPTEISEDIFEIKLNETGITYLRKFVLVARIGFVLLLITSAINIFQNIQFIARRYIEPRFDLPFAAGFFTYLLMIGVLLNVVAGWSYLRFANSVKNGIDSGSEYLINRAFRYLYQNAIIWVVIFSINLLGLILSITEVLL